MEGWQVSSQRGCWRRVAVGVWRFSSRKNSHSGLLGACFAALVCEVIYGPYITFLVGFVDTLSHSCLGLRNSLFLFELIRTKKKKNEERKKKGFLTETLGKAKGVECWRGASGCTFPSNAALCLLAAAAAGNAIRSAGGSFICPVEVVSWLGAVPFC